MMKYIYIFLVCLLQSVACGEMRVWHCTNGTSFVGEFIDERLNRYYFKDKDGKTRNVPAEDVVPADERYIRTVVAPEVRVDFSKKESVPKGRYADPDARIIDGTLSITKTSRKPFYGTLRAELYFIGEEVATDDNMMLAKKNFTIKFPEEKNPTVEVKLRAEARVYNEYGPGELRGRNYGGYAVVLLSTAGEIVEFKTDISWLTEENLQTFRAFEEFNFFDDDLKKRPVPRPDYYTARGYMP